jgi:hypothetical protein
MEKWIDVVGYEGKYEVSDAGRVRSVPRPRAKGGPLAMPPDFHGRAHVTLHKDGKQKVHHVHRLVAEAFFGPLPPGCETRHLDGNPLNNAASNLLYGTRSSNQRDAVEYGSHPSARKTHCPQGHPYDEINTYVDRTGCRHCRTCRSEQMRQYNERQRALKLLSAGGA